jgi:nitrogen fixation protein FixH
MSATMSAGAAVLPSTPGGVPAVATTGASVRRSASKWPLMVVGLIALNMVIVAVTVVKATGDESMATEPGYYEKAMGFNAIAAERDASRALAWQARVEIDASSQPAVLRVSMRDATGNPVQGCDVHVEAFANTRASKRARVELVERENEPAGEYVGKLDAQRSGLWTVRVRATRLEETFVHEEEVLVPAGQ